MAETGEGRSRYGVVYGIAAYGLWGLIPLYFKAVAQLLSFACIGTAVLIYTLDALRAACEYRIEVVEPD